jgi:hypothetical protein
MSYLKEHPYIRYKDIKHPDFIYNNITTIVYSDDCSDIMEKKIHASKSFDTVLFTEFLTNSPKAFEAQRLSDITDKIKEFNFKDIINGDDIINCTHCCEYYNKGVASTYSIMYFPIMYVPPENTYEIEICVNSYEYEQTINISTKFICVKINERYYTMTNALYNWLNDDYKPKKREILNKLIY